SYRSRAGVLLPPRPFSLLRGHRGSHRQGAGEASWQRLIPEVGPCPRGDQLILEVARRLDVLAGAAPFSERRAGARVAGGAAQIDHVGHQAGIGGAVHVVDAVLGGDVDGRGERGAGRGGHGGFLRLNVPVATRVVVGALRSRHLHYIT